MLRSLTYAQKTLALILGLLVFRILALIVSPLELHGDEAQYWAWAQDLDFGYYSKPPMVAWVIATTTAVFGDAEWAVRLGSPIIHSITAWLLFLTGRKLRDGQAGFWAAAIYILMPAVWLSSAIISTDVTLMMFWVLAINAWVHLRHGPSWPRAAQLGIALGLGFMSKYAMMFFGPALILAILFDAPTRRALFHLRGLFAATIAGLCIAPNIWWNARNDFATVAHTAENANLNEDMFHPAELLTFWVDQFGVFGPVTLGLLGFALWAAVKRRMAPPAFWLALLSLTPLLVISLEALLSRANANWAVTAYGAAPLLIVLWAMGYRKPEAWLKWGIIGQSLIALTLGLIMLYPAATNSLGAANAVKRMRGWTDTVAAIEARFKAGHEGQPYQAIAMDNRLVFYDAQYYGLRETAPFYMWMLQKGPLHHAEMTYPLTPQSGSPVLIINYYNNNIPFLQEDFARLDRLPDIDLDLGGGKRRRLNVWAGYDYSPTEDPNRKP